MKKIIFLLVGFFVLTFPILAQESEELPSGFLTCEHYAVRVEKGNLKGPLYFILRENHKL
jgi:hypothetical protein